MDIKWVKKEKKLFVDTGNYNEWAHFGWGDIKEQFYGYMEGYKRSADILIYDAIQSKNIAVIDTVIYPVCFLYRQYLELVMKNILIYYTEEDAVTGIKSGQHNLMKLWGLIEPYMKIEASNGELMDISNAKSYIEQFDKMDRSSFTFRYPINKDLRGILPGEKRINLVNLKEGMEELYNFFSGVEGKLDSVKQWKADVDCEYFYNY